MNKRIYRKIYKRANNKLCNFIKQNKDKRTTFEVENDERILSGLERRIFLKEHNRQMKLFEEIKAELVSEGKW